MVVFIRIKVSGPTITTRLSAVAVFRSIVMVPLLALNTTLVYSLAM